MNRLLKNVGRREAQSASVKEHAAALRSKLPRPETFDLFDVLATNEYEDGIMESQHITIPQSRRDQEERAYAHLRERFPDVNDRIVALEKMVNEVLAAGLEPVSLGDALQQFCQERIFLEGITEFVISKPGSVLVSLAQIPLSQWRSVDASEYQRYGTLFAQSLNFVLARAAAYAVSYGPAIDNPIPEDLLILTLLARREEGAVLGPVLFGLRRLAPVAGYSAPALELYANMRVGDDHHLAQEYCDFAGAYGIASGLLNPGLIERSLANLVDVKKLDRDTFGGLMARTCGVAPLAFVRFFESRILRRQSLEADDTYSEYEAVPSSFSWSSSSAARESSEYADAVIAFIDLLKRFPKFAHSLTPIFWHMATLEEITLFALDRLLHEEEDSGPALVNDLLRDGPKGLALSHPMFAMHVLGECVDRGAELERDARSTLFANALYGSGLRVYVGTAPEPPDHSHVSPANALSAQWAPGSLPSMFYAELANAERISFPAPRFSEFEGEEDDVDQPASELPPLQEEAPEESS